MKCALYLWHQLNLSQSQCNYSSMIMLNTPHVDAVSVILLRLQLTKR